MLPCGSLALNRKWDHTLGQQIDRVEYMSYKNFMGSIRRLKNSFLYFHSISLGNLKIFWPVGINYSDIWNLFVNDYAGL